MKRIVSVSGAMTFAQTIRSCQFWERSSLMSPLWHSQQLLRPVFKRMFYISWRWQSQNGLYCSVMFSAMITCLLFFQSPGSGAGGGGVRVKIQFWDKSFCLKAAKHSDQKLSGASMKISQEFIRRPAVLKLQSAARLLEFSKNKSTSNYQSTAMLSWF